LVWLASEPFHFNDLDGDMAVKVYLCAACTYLERAIYDPIQR